jgi:hypothetical protein
MTKDREDCLLDEVHDIMSYLKVLERKSKAEHLKVQNECFEQQKCIMEKTGRGNRLGMQKRTTTQVNTVHLHWHSQRK